MSKRDSLLSSIAETIKDYRLGEIEIPTPKHVARWISQFNNDVQLALLQEINHVLKQTYFSKEFVSNWFANQIKHEKLVGHDPCTFWHEANLLKIQQNGQSQTDIISLFGESLMKQCRLAIKNCGSPKGAFIYLDDVLFSGGRVGGDMSKWITETAPAIATVHILVIASHRLGEWQMTKRIEDAAKQAEKKIEFHTWASIRFENRKAYRNQAEVLWPAHLPEDEVLRAYMAKESKYPFEPRQVGGRLNNQIFSSEQGRQLLEREFLLAGVKILKQCLNPKLSLRPLGFSGFGLGFGSMIVTFRNCPNNCPLAFWWGNPNAAHGDPLGNWYPLFQRKTYSRSLSPYDFDF